MQYRNNPDYIPFSSTTNFQYVIAEFTRELFKYNDEVKEINVEEIVLETLKHYQEKKDYSVELTYTGIIDSLNSILAILDSKTKDETEITEEERKLNDIKLKYRSMAAEMHMEYQNKPEAQKGRMERTADIIDGLGFCGSTYGGDGSFECYTAKNDTVLIFMHVPVVEPFASPNHRMRNAIVLKQLFESYKNPIAVFQGHYHAAKITQHDNVLYVASPALVSYPNAFRVVNVSNYKDKVVFDFEWKETRETTIQKMAKILVFSGGIYAGEEKDRAGIYEIKKNKGR